VIRVVACGVCDQLPRAGCVLEGRHQRLGPFLDDVAVRGMALPTVAHTRDAPVWRDHQCQDHLLQVRPVVLGGAVGDRHGVRIAVRDRRASEREAGGVEMMEALIDPFLSADRKCPLRPSHVTAIGLGFIERAAQLQALAQLRREALTPHQSERCVGKKLWGPRAGPLGKAHAIEHHPGHGFAWREDFLGLWHEACGDHVNQASVFANSGDHADVLKAFDAHRFPWSTLP
jgi:hypothetical protein